MYMYNGAGHKKTLPPFKSNLKGVSKFRGWLEIRDTGLGGSSRPGVTGGTFGIVIIPLSLDPLDGNKGLLHVQ